MWSRPREKKKNRTARRGRQSDSCAYDDAMQPGWPPMPGARNRARAHPTGPLNQAGLADEPWRSAASAFESLQPLLRKPADRGSAAARGRAREGTRDWLVAPDRPDQPDRRGPE